MLKSSIQALARSLWRLSTLGVPTGAHIVRYSMYKSLRRVGKEVDLGTRILSISQSAHIALMMGGLTENIVEASYPKYSLCNLALPSDTYTAVVSDQVLEHISCHPQKAIDECYRVLAPGGIAIHTTCFLTPYHGSPDHADETNGDYWRYTPSGLRLLHQNYSRVIAADGWGTPLMPIVGALGLNRMPIPDRAWHPLNKLATTNRPSYAFVVWVVAQK